MSVVDKLRRAAAHVASVAGTVTIDLGRLAAYAEEIGAEVPAGPPESEPEPPDPLRGASPEELAAYALTLDAINFGSGWFPLLRKPAGLSGYRTIERAFDRRVAESGPWSACELAEIDRGDLASVLGQDPELELIGHYADSLSDLGHRIAAGFEGRFLGPIEAAEGFGVALVEELAGWDSFADSSTYDGMPVPLLKRAQIAAADLHRIGAARFGDLNRLTLFADNLVPHVLRLDGVLRFDPEMVGRIEAGELLEHGSPEEVEMRACAVHAGELLSERLSRAPFAIDHFLWERGGGPRYKSVPRPRCRTTAY